LGRNRDLTGEDRPDSMRDEVGHRVRLQGVREEIALA
jgi:hypothetical protein